MACTIDRVFPVSKKGPGKSTGLFAGSSTVTLTNTRNDTRYLLHSLRYKSTRGIRFLQQVRLSDYTDGRDSTDTGFSTRSIQTPVRNTK